MRPTNRSDAVTGTCWDPYTFTDATGLLP